MAAQSVLRAGASLKEAFKAATEQLPQSCRPRLPKCILEHTEDSDQAALIMTDRIIEKQQETVGWQAAGVNQAIKPIFSLKVAALSGYLTSTSISSRHNLCQKINVKLLNRSC